MADLDKAIQGLKHCKKYGTMGGNSCFGHYEYTVQRDAILVDEHRHDCPYGDCLTGCVVTLASDAIELLKEYKDLLDS